MILNKINEIKIVKTKILSTNNDPGTNKPFY